MDLKLVRTTPDGELPWTKNTIHKFSSKGTYPDVIIKVGGMLYVDMDAFRDRVEKIRASQVKKHRAATRVIG